MTQIRNPMDKTLKLHAFGESPKKVVTAESRAGEQHLSHELAKKTSQYEEEKSKNLELLKTIVQLRESLKQEQGKTVKLESKLNKLDTVEENQLVRKNAQLEEERTKSNEFVKTIEQLKATIKQDQVAIAEMKAKIHKLETEEEDQNAKSGELEEEKRKSLEHVQTIEQLRKSAEADRSKTTAMESRVKELSNALDRIVQVAATGKSSGED